MRLLTCIGKMATASEFVAFWKQGYSKNPDNDDKLYFENIEQFTPLARDEDYSEARKCLDALFRWKNMNRNLSKSKKAFVKVNWQVIRGGRVSEVIDNPRYALQHLLSGGAIYRIFFLHCCLPYKFPIYDQHVHRAMWHIAGLESNRELSGLRNNKVIDLYLEEYCGFWKEFSEKVSESPRDVDRALWAYGKMLYLTPWLFSGF